MWTLRKPVRRVCTLANFGRCMPGQPDGDQAHTGKPCQRPETCVGERTNKALRTGVGCTAGTRVVPRKERMKPHAVLSSVSPFAPVDPHALHLLAEHRLQERQAASTDAPADLSLMQNQALIHELQVHQIELELQNAELRRTQSEMADLQAHYFDLFDLAPVGYITLDAQGLLRQANLYAATLLGVSRQALPGQPIEHYIFRDDQDIYYLHRQQLLGGSGAQEFELRLQQADGKTCWAHLTLTAVHGAGQAPVLQLTLADITERKRVSAALQESEQRFRHFFEVNSCVMLLIEPLSGQIMDANRTAVDYYGYHRAKLVGMPISRINATAPQPLDLDQPLPVPEKRRYPDFTHRLASGELRYVELYSTPIQSGERALLFCIIHDTTERRRLEDKVRQMAFYDPLTQLPNRRLLNDRLAQAMVASTRTGSFCAFMVLDLDNFKPLNDLHGHLVGDLLLIEVAQRLSACVRAVDTVGRFGGDEFIVLLSELQLNRDNSTAQATTIANKIRLSLAAPYRLTVSQEQTEDKVVEHNCTASIGVLMFVGADTALKDILTWADAAMYRAKDEGRNRVTFYAPA